MKYLLVFLLSLVASLIIYPKFITMMKKFSFNQEVSDYALEEFQEKAKTPTMGGIVFLIVPLLSLLIIDYKAYLNTEVILIVLAFLSFGLIGLYDDYLILVKQDNIGFTTLKKFTLELVLAIIFGIIWYKYNDGNLGFHIPYTSIFWGIGWLYVLVIIFMLSGVSNAVNLTDGMDGLAGGTVLIALIPYMFFAYKLNDVNVLLLLFSIVGSLLAYLFYNVKPAKVIMGDVGSLSLGALLASVSIVLAQELSLIIIGMIFVLETLSVIIQIGSVKLRKKRVFPFTPIHYSFTIWGMKEKNVVYLFWAVGFVFMLLGLLMGVNL